MIGAVRVKGMNYLKAAVTAETLLSPALFIRICMGSYPATTGALIAPCTGQGKF